MNLCVEIKWISVVQPWRVWQCNPEKIWLSIAIVIFGPYLEIIIDSKSYEKIYLQITFHCESNKNLL